MIGDSKILTVSYGTFSCTLEGFDDPFNTMRAIAEYFRDLAAEDRYFGAEPPTPDAAMLHRIAEREVSRMVEARVQDNSVFLRQHDAAPAAQVTAPVAAPMAAPIATPFPAQPAPADETPIAIPTPVAAAPVMAPVAATPADVEPAFDIERFVEAAQAGLEPEAEEESDLPLLHDVIPGGVAAKLARIRQSVSYRAMPAAAEDQPDAVQAFVEPQPAEVEPQAEAAVHENTAVAEPHFEAEEDLLPEDYAVGSAEDELPAQELSQPAEQDDVTDTAGVDDVLARLGALLADSEEAGEPGELQSVAEEDVAKADVGEIDGDEGEDEDGITPTGFADEAVNPPGPMLLLSDALVEDADEDDFAASDDLVPSDAAGDAPDQPFVLSAAVTGHQDEFDADEADVAETRIGPLAADEDDEPASDRAMEDEDDAFAEATADDGASESEDAPKRAHARVIRIRRADADEGDDESDLGRADDPSRPFDSAGEAIAMSRLMRQADDEMAGAENRRRLSAIAHLKAAVAATEAERAVTGEALSAPTAKIGPYLDDLAHAVQPEDAEASKPAPVRPRREVVSVRPEGPRPGTIRPGMMTAPPLVLVSEQRIDRTPPVGQPMVALRPGRLSGAIGSSAASAHAPVAEDQYAAAMAEFEEDEDADTDNIFSDDAGFAQFVEKLGLTSLTERLEAAAAFATIVENRDSFTRPQLMRRLSGGTSGGPLTREDGLRSFGTLLRTGRIEKVRRGQYTLANDSPYLAEARRLAL